MKKFFALFLAFMLIFSLAACGQEDTITSNLTSNISSGESSVLSSDNVISDASSSETVTTSTESNKTSSAELKETKDCAIILELSINPRFQISLDKDYTTISVKPLTDDAIEMLDGFRFYGDESLETIIDSLISLSKNNGISLRNRPVYMNVTFAKKTTVDVEKFTTRLNNITSEMSSKYHAIVKFQLPNELTGSSSKETHSHSFSSATCTEPQKCSCGATNGTKLGHSWKAATCKAPKTCTLCKTTTGSKTDHKYSSGKCIYCGKKEVIDPKTVLKTNKDYYALIDLENGHFNLGVYQFSNSKVICKAMYSTDPSEKINNQTITYKSKKFYPLDIEIIAECVYSFTDTEIIIKEIEVDDPIEYRLAANKDHNLVITYSSDGYAVGTIFELQK